MKNPVNDQKDLYAFGSLMVLKGGNHQSGKRTIRTLRSKRGFLAKRLAIYRARHQESMFDRSPVGFRITRTKR